MELSCGIRLSGSNLSSEDRVTLMALDEGRWADKLSWSSFWDVDVDAQDNARVVALVLSQKSLRGYIPAALGNLTGLQVIHLRSNNLQGPIPAQLGKLANLVELDLSENRLTGPVPAELGRLEKLEKLDLIGNNLCMMSPATLFGHRDGIAPPGELVSWILDAVDYLGFLRRLARKDPVAIKAVTRVMCAWGLLHETLYGLLESESSWTLGPVVKIVSRMASAIATGDVDHVSIFAVELYVQAAAMRRRPRLPLAVRRFLARIKVSWRCNFVSREDISDLCKDAKDVVDVMDVVALDLCDALSGGPVDDDNVRLSLGLIMAFDDMLLALEHVCARDAENLNYEGTDGLAQL